MLASLIMRLRLSRLDEQDDMRIPLKPCSSEGVYWALRNLWPVILQIFDGFLCSPFGWSCIGYTVLESLYPCFG